MDFSLDKYEHLLESITVQDLPIYTVKNWIVKKPKRGVLLRNDVDRLPINALNKARLESKYNIFSTYYFRATQGNFPQKIIKEIADLGHEIGYHYEDLVTAQGNKKKALYLFQKNLTSLRKIVPVQTVAMHGNPLSTYDNYELLNSNILNRFNLIGDAHKTINYLDIYYFTDTGRNWSDKSPNIRDKVKSNKKCMLISTDQLIDFIRKYPSAKIAIVTHPERWNNNLIKWLFYFLFDTTVNLIKKTIISYH